MCEILGDTVRMLATFAILFFPESKRNINNGLVCIHSEIRPMPMCHDRFCSSSWSHLHNEFSSQTMSFPIESMLMSSNSFGDPCRKLIRVTCECLPMSLIDTFNSFELNTGFRGKRERERERDVV